MQLGCQYAKVFNELVFEKLVDILQQIWKKKFEELVWSEYLQ